MALIRNAKLICCWTNGQALVSKYNFAVKKVLDCSSLRILPYHAHQSNTISLRENVDTHTKKIVRTKNADGLLTIEGKGVPNTQKGLVADTEKGACPLCALDLDIKYTDILIISQFLRKDGRLLPRRDTGLCAKQQNRMSRLVHMAHNAGLLSSLRPPMRGGRQRRPDKESNFSFRGLNRYFTENYS